MAMFFMSMTSFGDYYPALDRTDHEINGKVSFYSIYTDFFFKYYIRFVRIYHFTHENSTTIFKDRKTSSQPPENQCQVSFCHMFSLSANVHHFYGNCGHSPGQHVDRHDGKYVSENCRNEKRMAETGQSIKCLPKVYFQKLQLPQDLAIIAENFAI